MRKLMILISILFVGASAQAGERDELAAKRAAALDALHDYWVHGDFPINVTKARMINIFRDGSGRLCAVANLIHASGRNDLVDAQVAHDNYIALKDLRGGDIADWMLESGLTREELVDLQGEGYIPMTAPNLEPTQMQLAQGVNVVIPAGTYQRIAEKAALRTRLSAAELILRAQSDTSLDTAAARLHEAHRVKHAVASAR